MIIRVSEPAWQMLTRRNLRRSALPCERHGPPSRRVFPFKFPAAPASSLAGCSLGGVTVTVPVVRVHSGPGWPLPARVTVFRHAGGHGSTWRKAFMFNVTYRLGSTGSAGISPGPAPPGTPPPGSDVADSESP